MSEYLIDKISPRYKIHLLAGISSAGKSRWIVPSLIMFGAAMPVLGLKSYPVKWSIVCRDRPLSDVHDTVTRMGFSIQDVDVIPALGIHKKNFVQIMEEIKRRESKFVLWEGIDMMVKNINSHGEVEEFLGKLTAYCEEGLTVLGSTGVAKLKPHETYENPRQLVAGSTLWERMTSTNFVIQPINPLDIADPRRLLHVSLKNDPSFVVCGQFDHNGILVFDGWEQREIGSMVAKAKYSERVKVWEQVR